MTGRVLTLLAAATLAAFAVGVRAITGGTHMTTEEDAP